MTGLGAPDVLVRAAALYLPICLVIALAVHTRPSRPRLAGAVVAFSWNVAALFVVNLVAVRAGWWTFGVDTALVGGVPADLWFGWALLWGAVPILATDRRPAVAAVGLVVVDLVLMPLADPVVDLSGSWLVGEAVAIATCLVPGLLLGMWTARDERLVARATLQLLAFTGLLYLVLPALIFTVTGEGWAVLLDRPRWQFVLAALAVSGVAAMAVQSVREFVRHGGTPVPLDPPTRLVTTGPYAYVANPMQVSGTVLLAMWGFLLASPAVVAAAVMGAVFSAGVAAWSEETDLDRRFGEDWRRYRDSVRLWIPRWRPHVTEAAVVHVAVTCEPCAEVGGFLRARRPVGLTIEPAEMSPRPLERLTYERGGVTASGIAGICHSLEHTNLAWAAVGWIGCLPGVQQLLQLIGDAVGGGPRRLEPVTASPRSTEPHLPR